MAYHLLLTDNKPFISLNNFYFKILLTFWAHFRKARVRDYTPLNIPKSTTLLSSIRTHKVNSVKQAIQSVGAKLIYLPPYSPDFNPIEMIWSKLKAILRKCES